jgi:CheY-like chemotaxis protein
VLTIFFGVTKPATTPHFSVDSIMRLVTMKLISRQASERSVTSGETHAAHPGPGTGSEAKKELCVKIRALIFDDSYILRDLLRHVFEKRGYEVFTFEDPAPCALHQIGRCLCNSDQLCTDIIISDINMYTVSGLELVDELIKNGCKVKNIALMSGSWLDFHRFYARKLGCKMFNKPFAIGEIVNWLQECEKRTDPNRKLSDWFLT